MRNKRTGVRLPSDPHGIELLRAARPELHAWSTSATWGDMDVEVVEEARRLIEEFGTNGLIPWAMVHNNHESDKLSPPATTRISGNANSPFFTNDGKLEVTKAYYFYKQLTRAGQAGMAVAATLNENGSPVTGIAFARGATKHPHACADDHKRVRMPRRAAREGDPVTELSLSLHRRGDRHTGLAGARQLFVDGTPWSPPSLPSIHAKTVSSRCTRSSRTRISLSDSWLLWEPSGIK